MTSTDQQTCDQLRMLVDAAAPAVGAPDGLARDVLRRASTTPRRRRPGRRAATGTIGLVLVGATAVAAAGLTGRGQYQEWTQPSAAMTPTVAVGQRVVLEQDAAPARGDLVLVDLQIGGQAVPALSRVVGLPGDSVSCPAERDGTCRGVVVSGSLLSEPWLTVPTDPFPATVVPAGGVFVLGDARDQANDSRQLGPQRLDAVHGVAVARLADDGQPEPLPGAPDRTLPEGSRFDPADPVPPASAR